MGLVNELQESAEREDVLTVLRKAKRLSAKLGRSDISDWLGQEQNGYPSGIELPMYRQVAVSFCYNTNGYIPAGYGQIVNGIVPLHGLQFSTPPRVPIADPISTIASWLTSMQGGQGIYMPVPQGVADYIRRMFSASRPEILNQISFMAKLDETQVRNIPEQVKDKVLDWACALEQAGITGDGQTFSNEERRAAQSVTFNISHAKIDQLNSAGDNIKES